MGTRNRKGAPAIFLILASTCLTFVCGQPPFFSQFPPRFPMFGAVRPPFMRDFMGHGHGHGHSHGPAYHHNEIVPISGGYSQAAAPAFYAEDAPDYDGYSDQGREFVSGFSTIYPGNYKKSPSEGNQYFYQLEHPKPEAYPVKSQPLYKPIMHYEHQPIKHIAHAVPEPVGHHYERPTIHREHIHVHNIHKHNVHHHDIHRQHIHQPLYYKHEKHAHKQTESHKNKFKVHEDTKYVKPTVQESQKWLKPIYAGDGWSQSQGIKGAAESH